MHKVISCSVLVVICWMVATGLGLPWLFNQNSWLSLLFFVGVVWVGAELTYFYIKWAVKTVRNSLEKK